MTRRNRDGICASAGSVLLDAGNIRRSADLLPAIKALALMTPHFLAPPVDVYFGAPTLEDDNVADHMFSACVGHCGNFW